MYKCTLFDQCLNQDSCMACTALSDVSNNYPLYRDKTDPVYKKGYEDGYEDGYAAARAIIDAKLLKLDKAVTRLYDKAKKMEEYLNGLD